MKKYCRCCFADDCSNDFIKKYYCGESTEVYLDLLFTTFNIKISKYQEDRCLICDECIVKLQDAATFRKQILKTEEKFIKLVESKHGSTVDTNVTLKIERVEDEFSDFDDHVSNFSETDFMCDNLAKENHGQIFVIKIEDEKVVNKKEMPKTLSLMAKYVRMFGEQTQNSKQPAKTQAKSTKIKSTPDMKKKSTKCKVKLNKTRSKGSISEEHIIRRDNTIKLIENSNMCLFRSMRTKYGCYFCKDSFVDPHELRKHRDSHTNWKFLAVRSLTQMRVPSYKNVDISLLKCTQCSESCVDIVDLNNHLRTHNVIVSNSESFLIPFKLKDGYVCVECNQKYQSFTRLSMHMHSHYSHQVCEICGLAYINRISLRTHINAIHKERKCSQCPAIFVTYSEKLKHMRKNHNVRRAYKRYCNLCDKTFRYTYMLEKHKIQEHNAHRPTTNCTECGKTFASPNFLKVHTRSVHIKERNYPCAICGMGFFTSTDQRRHERTHEDVRSFSCNYCDSKFKSKDSCRRHLKRQHGHVFK